MDSRHFDGLLAEIIAGDGTSEALTLGAIHEVEPPEGWAPLSEAAAFVVVNQVVRSRWTSALGLTDVSVEVARRVYDREAASKRASANRCTGLGYSGDAGVLLQEARKNFAVARCLTSYPAVWEHVQELLRDDDVGTWEARAATAADEHYPGWRNMPFGLFKVLSDEMDGCYGDR